MRLEQNTTTCDLQSPADGLNATKEIRGYICENLLALTRTTGTAVEHASAMLALDCNNEDFLSAERACFRFFNQYYPFQPND
jgi:hypothetical protein